MGSWCEGLYFLRSVSPAGIGADWACSYCGCFCAEGVRFGGLVLADGWCFLSRFSPASLICQCRYPLSAVIDGVLKQWWCFQNKIARRTTGAKGFYFLAIIQHVYKTSFKVYDKSIKSLQKSLARLLKCLYPVSNKPLASHDTIKSLASLWRA